jgi:hypothetical protein
VLLKSLKGLKQLERLSIDATFCRTFDELKLLADSCPSNLRLFCFKPESLDRVDQAMATLLNRCVHIRGVRMEVKYHQHVSVYQESLRKAVERPIDLKVWSPVVGRPNPIDAW